MSYSFTTFNDRIEQTIQHIQSDFGTIRTGRASIQLVDKIKVEAYGTWMDLQELAVISLPDPHLIIIKPFDRSVLESIAKSITKSELHLQPVIDKETIKIAIPSLTEERRKELVKVLNQKIENGKVMLRSVRTDAKRDIESQKGQDGISEDDIRLDIEQLDKYLKIALEKIEKMGADKEQELMTV